MSKYHVERFLEAQNKAGYGSYQQALAEIKAGRKTSHWIWYVFPQHIRLGRSEMNRRYGITCAAEAKEYMENEVLRERLQEIGQVMYELDTTDPVQVLGIPDAYKLQSCCTLFRVVSGEYRIFDLLLDKYYGGEPCRKTLEYLEEETPFFSVCP